MWLTESKVRNLIAEECNNCIDKIYGSESKFENTYYQLLTRIDRLEEQVHTLMQPVKPEIKTYPINKTHQADYFTSDSISTGIVIQSNSLNWDISSHVDSTSSDSTSSDSY